MNSQMVKFHQNLTIVNLISTICLNRAYKTLSIIPKLYVDLPILLFYVNIARIINFFWSG